MALTAAVALGWWPVSVDHYIAGMRPGSQANGTAPLVLALASGVTTLATPQVTVGLTVLLAGAFSWQERCSAPVRAVLRPLAALTVTVLAGKAVLRRPGPPGSHLHHLLGYYPSGHATTALVCAGLLLRLTRARHPHWRPHLKAASTAWTLTVAASLVIHRYHWLTDVLAGLLLGTLILALTSRRATKRGSSERGKARFAPTAATTPGSDVLRAAVTAGHQRFGESSDVAKEA